MKCPNCNFPASEVQEQCPNCSYSLPPKPKKTIEIESEDTVLCSNCGAINTSSEVKCTHCNIPMSSQHMKSNIRPLKSYSQRDNRADSTDLFQSKIQRL